MEGQKKMSGNNGEYRILGARDVCSTLVADGIWKRWICLNIRGKLWDCNMLNSKG
jgi:hypothetical protein